MLLPVFFYKLHSLINRIRDIAIRRHSYYLNILNLSRRQILSKLLQTLPLSVAELDKSFALLFILIVDGLEVFTLTGVFGFDDLDEFPLHLLTVLVDHLLGVGFELLEALLVGGGVEVADVAVLVPA